MYKYLKRFFDLIMAIIFLVVFFMPFLLIMLVLSITQRKIFFVQQRVGHNEKIFAIYKFQTMNDKRDSKGELLSDEKRITRLGSLLRKTSLDELPQLFNILKGEMSFIGPRPLLVDYLPLYSENDRKRHLVRPGLTGLAQISGRNNISWDEKFKLDIHYVENITFFHDLKIFLMTIKKVLVREGISLEGHLTTQPFEGYEIK